MSPRHSDGSARPNDKFDGSTTGAMDSGGSRDVSDAESGMGGMPSPTGSDKSSNDGIPGTASDGGGGGGNASGEGPAMPVQKRRRVTRACDECRRKKIKCNGKQPCTHCSVYSYGTHDPPSPPLPTQRKPSAAAN